MPDIKLGKRILKSKILLIISLLVLLFFTVNLSREIINRRDLQGEISALQEKIDGLKSRNTELVGLIEYFKTPDFVETEARTKLNLKKPGETIIIVPEPGELKDENKNITNEPAFITATVVKEISNPQKWWNYFLEVK